MKNMCASFLGGLIGCVLFLMFATYFFGQPFGDWFMSAHGIFAADRQREMTETDNLLIYNMLSRGLIISSDSVISNITNLYGNMIQVLTGMLAAVSILGFFAVRWQSVQAAQEYVDAKSTEFFKSEDFKSKVHKHVQDYVDTFDPANNPQIYGGNYSAEVLELRNRLDELERFISRTASPEESTEQVISEDKE